MPRSLKKFVLPAMLVVIISISGVKSVSAEEPPIVPSSIPVMPRVTVTGKRIDTLTTTKTIDQELIEKLPSSNGTITDLLKTVPGVQFSEELDNSRTGGEILPAEISISGGRTHENNFVLDGLGINNLIDPSSTTNTVEDIPGHSLEYFIPEHLIKDITVYRSNIPASYGSFTGGAVVADTKDPETEFTGQISYRMTRSAWGQFYIDSADTETFNNSTDSSNQPDFRKYSMTSILHFPITANASGLLSYSRLESTIPLILIDEKHVEYRKSENFFFKYQIEPDSRTKITLSTSYSPYQADKYLKNTLNSDYSLESGGYIVDGKLSKDAGFAEIEFALGWGRGENSRQAPQNWKNWRVSSSKNWGALIGKSYSPEGGYGDIEKLQNSLSGKINIDFKELPTGSVKHKFNTGIEFDRTEAVFDRLDTTTRYSAAKTTTLVDCNGDNNDCIDGEQFFWYKTVYPQNTARAEISNYHAYLDDNISVYRLKIRPGLRVSYNDYQKNTDYALRLATSFDLFNNQKTILSGGINRYYGTELLRHKLTAQKPPYQVWRRSTALDAFNHPQAWEQKPRSTIGATQVSDLKTPYSDEFTIGLKQQLLGGKLELVYIDRTYKDQIMTITLDKDADGYIYQEYRNSGKRYHEEFSVSWEKSWRKHYLSVNLTWQKTKSNSLNYSDQFDPDIDKQLVWYDGKVVSVDKLQTSDFNRPYTASIIYAADLPKGFSFTNETHYTSRYRAVEKTGDTLPYDGIDLDVYDDVSNPSTLIFDWKLLWQSPEWYGNSLELSVDILNVFNRKVVIGNAVDEYKLGRQYWAGLTYKF